MKKLRFLILGLLTMAAVCQAQITDPGWYQADNEMPDPELFGSGGSGSTVHAHALTVSGPTFSSLNVPTSPIAEVITPQIQALADGLQHDPQQIFDYVHDQIRFVLYFGSKKGAQLTLLEKSGNDFDQCALLVALLQASGYTNAQYQFGWQLIPYDDPDGNDYDLHHWWQLTLTNSSWTNTVAFLGHLTGIRGYPKTYYVPDGNTFEIQRMWVALTIGADTYQLDPAFKVSELTSGISLPGAMSSTSISNGLSSAADGTDGSDFVKTVGENGVRNNLSDYTGNLVDYIQIHSPNASVQDILGGWQITPADNDWVYSTHTTFPVDTSIMPVLAWTYEPTNLMSTLTVAFAGTNHQWFIPQLQGQRLSLTFDASSSAQLWLDDTNIITKSVTGGSTAVALLVTHPWGTWDTTSNLFIPSLTNGEAV